MLLVVGVLGVIAMRLVQVQVIDREQYLSEISRHITTSLIAGDRGNILSRDGSFLVTTDSSTTIGANPQLITNAYPTALLIAAELNMSEQKIYELLSREDRNYVHLKREVAPDVVDNIRKLNLDGIAFREEPDRAYPNGDGFARNLLGQVDVDETPLNGIEKQFNQQLAGQPGSRVDYVSLSDQPVKLRGGDLNYEAPRRGSDVRTTIHIPIQRSAEEALKKSVLESGANWGTAIVLDVATAEVLALTDISIDKESGEPWVPGKSHAYIKAFEPGSVVKTFTIATALDLGYIHPEEVFEVPHKYQYADKEFDEPYVSQDRQLTVSEILSKSSNIGTIQIGERVGPDQLYSYLHRFGLGRYSTGSDEMQGLPGETRGKLKRPQDWEGTVPATIAFGQGVSVTAIQLAAAYNVIANDGRYTPASLVQGFETPDGSFRRLQVLTSHTVLSATTAKQMRDMLEGVVMNGTGTRAAVNGYGVAGKTGTAEKPKDGAYCDCYTTIFAGFAPVADPRITVVVVLDEPEDQAGAGLIAAPLFSEIATKALGILGVPKTR